MTFICEPNIQPRAEVCNGLDDDCDGVVDNPEAPGLCPSGEVCSQGVCVFPCSTGEFPCLPPGVCDDSDGLCKDPSCKNVTCNSDQICVRGQCIGGCDNVTCPPGEVCRIGNCVDPCQGITCGDGQVCENGACLGTCGCRNCPAGKVCSTQGPTAGKCIDQGCDTTSCSPPQTVCVNGQCVDGCAGVQCPAGQSCSGGVCSEVDGGIVGGTPGTQPDAGAVSGTGGSRPGTGGTVGPNGTGGATGSGGGSGPHESGVTTCSCDTASGPGAGGLALMLAGLAVALARRQVARRKR